MIPESGISGSQIEINQEKVDHVIGEAEKETNEKGKVGCIPNKTVENHSLNHTNCI